MNSCLGAPGHGRRFRNAYKAEKDSLVSNEGNPFDARLGQESLIAPHYDDLLGLLFFFFFEPNFLLAAEASQSNLYQKLPFLFL